MAIFTAIATAIGTAIGLAGTALTIFTAVGATLLSVGVSSLIARRMAPDIGDAGGPGGGRVQLPPATDNKIPVVYGSAFVGGPVIDAKISSDQKTMWYVVALAEHTDSTAGSGYTFDTSNIYYDGKLVQFGSNGVVTGLINNSTTPSELDTKMNGKINIYLFTNGSSSGVNTGGQTAIQILQDGSIPAAQRWTATDTMTNCAFAIVKVKYDTEAGTTSLGALMCKITNSITKPGDVLLDYMQNVRYGCAIPLTRIDTASLTALNAYSDELITYVPVGGGSATQARYRINGPLDTGRPCLDNLQEVVDACDSWLQYSELTAKWKVVINQSYTDYTTIGNLFLVDSSNLVGGINIAPINLNETFNEVEVQYPNKNIKDQNDYQIVELSDYQPDLLSPNEAVNRLQLSLPIVNEAVQAKYIAVRRLLQSREDLTITFQLDYSGIQVEAGDVIRVKHDKYGWDILNGGEGKLFRVANVAEEKYADGSLGVRIAAFEYNDSVYADNAIQDFVPEDNIGISDPNIIGTPDAPIASLDLANTIAIMNVSGNIPDVGLVRYLDFNYGTDSNSANHLYYTTVSNANGEPLINSDSANATYTTYTIDVTDLATGNYYWSVTAKNDIVGVRSNASANAVSWTGPAVTSFNGNTGGITGNNIQANTISLTNLDKNLNVRQGFGGVNFSIANIAANTVTMPINAAANSTRNVPIYFTGTSVSSTNYYPWYQGTSSTTSGTNGNNYYAANSTSSFNPAYASQILLADGDDNWYTVIYDDFPAGTVPSDQSYFMNYGLTFVSNVADTVVQIVPGLEFSNVGYYEVGTDSLHTLTLQANLPQVYGASFNASGNTVANLTSGALLVRCITSGANLVIIKGSLESSKGQNPYF